MELTPFFCDRNVFAGLANDKLNRLEEAEKAYLAATRIKDNDRTAWQGLISLYEKQGSQKLDSYHEAVIKLGKIFADKYVSFLETSIGVLLLDQR